MRRRELIGRLVIAALLVAGAGAAWRWRGLFDPRGLPALIGSNPLAPVVFLLIHIAGSLFFVPRTLLAVGSGLVFGMWWGIVWAALGSVSGAIAGFLIARYVNAGFVERANPTRLATLLAQVERGGWRGVALVRLLPIIPHSLTNYALGLTRLGLRSVAFGSLIGQFPLTVAYADLGAAGGQALLAGPDWRNAVLWPSVIGIAALLLSLVIPVMARAGWGRRGI